MDDIYERLRKRTTESTLPPKPAVKPPAVRHMQPSPATTRQVPEGSHPKKSKRWMIILGVVIMLIGAGSAGAMAYLKERSLRSRFETNGQKAPADPLPEKSKVVDTTIRLVATGDMIGHESINKNAQKSDGRYDYVSLMSGMRPFFAKSDVSFCNQATPAGGAEFGISGYPSFNSPVEFARGIEAVGCNVINLGTNHTNDKGQSLVDATVAAWDDRTSVLAVGGANRSAEERQKQRIFTVKGLKFGFLSYSTYTNKPVTNSFGLTMYDEATAKSEIAALKENTDFVIVSMRWGTEYSPDVNAQQDQISQVLADAGADVILGHGPHTLQPVKRVQAADGREAIAWFSLGNFLNSQLDIETLIGGFAVMDIDIASKKITNIGFMPVYQHYEWTADQARRRNNADLLARHSFSMVPLDQAAELLGKSHHGTTVEAQDARVTQLLNKFTEIKIIKSSEF